MTDKTTVMPVNIFSLKDTFDSAQPLMFYGEYDNERDTLSYAERGKAITVEFSGNRDSGNLTVSGDVADGAVSKRFRLYDDIESVYEKISTDRFMKQAIVRHRGMRVTLNDPWEATLCFLISQFNNVKRIRKIVRNIIGRFGEEVYLDDGRTLHTFPSPERLSEVSEKELLACGTGFRAKYVHSVAVQCRDNINLNAIENHSYGKLKSELMELDGVGKKVADCVALMGYGKLEAFPIDVWVKRTMETLYFNGKVKRVDSITDFAEERWGKLAGYANQYLFHSARTDKEDSVL